MKWLGFDNSHNSWIYTTLIKKFSELLPGDALSQLIFLFFFIFLLDYHIYH